MNIFLKLRKILRIDVSEVCRKNERNEKLLSMSEKQQKLALVSYNTMIEVWLSFVRSYSCQSPFQVMHKIRLNISSVANSK